jgi:hypothetical protein
MKKKTTSRRRIDVNVDELDRIIEAAMQAPLNETDGRTLKTAVHAMAEKISAAAKHGENQCRAGTESTTRRSRYAGTGETGGCGTRAQRRSRIYGSKQSRRRACHAPVGRLAPPIQMCDALSRNSPKLVGTLLANCLAHGNALFYKTMNGARVGIQIEEGFRPAPGTGGNVPGGPVCSRLHA